jgi:hypothetical protein
MAIAEQNHFATEKVRNHDASIALGYLTLAIIFLVVLYLASTSPGTASGDFSWMVAFP